jgi:dsDNA-specific endonuclease/ATPase MutS2
MLVERAHMTHDEWEPAELPINGVLDLHTFRPCDAADIVREYVAECRRRGILQIRIVHGKGMGALRATVHAALKRLPEVIAFSTAPENAGGWGATVVELRAAARQ